jgi:hypothetical protein
MIFFPLQTPWPEGGKPGPFALLIALGIDADGEKHVLG